MLLQVAQFRDIKRPPVAELLGSVVANTIEHLVLAKTEVDKAKGGIRFVGSQVTGGIDNKRDGFARRRLFIRFQYFNRTINLIEPAAITAKTASMDIGYSPFEAR